ncbi:hypothetical protein F975_01509 [Acinetobacter sp. ANC 3789]|nr:hypothetical protein F975_01509 [Acinetobacter sp. ANC 3789]
MSLFYFEYPQDLSPEDLILFNKTPFDYGYNL